MGSVLWLSLAFAAPDHGVAQVETSTGVEDVVASADEAWIAFTTVGGELGVLDTATWTPFAVEITGGTASGGVAIGGPGGDQLFAGLSSKTIEVWTLVGGSTPNFTAQFAVPGTPLALSADSSTLYVLYEDPANGPALQAYDLTNGNFTARYAAAADLPQDGYEDMDARLSTDENGLTTTTFLYVAQGGAQLTRISLGTDSASTVRDAENEGAFDIADVWTEPGGSSTWFANSDGNTSYGYESSDSADLDITSPSSPDIGATSAVGGSTADAWVGLSNSEGLHVYAYSGGTSVGDELAVIPEAADATDIATTKGYGFVGTAEGLEVVTDRPWVEITEVSSTSVAADDTFTLSFTSDSPGDWKVNEQVAGLGETPETIDGATGTIDAGGSATATLSLPAVEGGDARYLVEVQVIASGETFYGRDGTYIYVNAPPPTPTIDATTVSFGDQRIEVKFTAFDTDSAQAYPIWVSTEPWTADDYPTDGPAYVGPDDWPAEGLVALPEDGVVDCIIDGVTNGTTYYVGAQSIDVNEDGTEEKSAMSDVYAVTPAETFSVSERLGIESWCGLPLESAGWFGAVGAAVAVLRRRRPGVQGAGRGAGRVGAGAGLVLAGLLAPAVAHAKPHEDDLTPRNWDFELRYGPFITQDSTALTDAFGTSDNRLLRGQVGYTQNLFQVDLGFGLYSDTGGQSTASGDASSDSDKLNAVPLSVEGTLRLDFLPEQPVVPFARAGGDLWIWNETWTSANDASGGGDTTAGTFGWHWGAGLMILLDPLDEGSASRLETLAGINDTYLVAEYQQSYALGEKKLDFTSTEVTFGLKFDF
jgi:hypothetical protein